MISLHRARWPDCPYAAQNDEVKQVEFITEAAEPRDNARIRVQPPLAGAGAKQQSASSPPSDDMQAASKRASIVLPPTCDKPGSIGVDSTLTGMLYRDPMGVASTPKSYIVSAARTMPVTPDELSGLRQWPEGGGDSMRNGANLRSSQRVRVRQEEHILGQLWNG